MDETSLIHYITGTFAKIQVASAEGNSFFYYAPAGQIPERTFPFATLVTKDDYDHFSNLNRPGIYRLNVGVSKTTYLALFRVQPSAPKTGCSVETGHDFTLLDQLLPHPLYAHLFWVSVLNPGPVTWQKMQALLAEAYAAAVGQQSKRESPE